MRENLVANGLEDFYQFRDRPLEPVSGRLEKKLKYAYLDDAEFQSAKLEKHNGMPKLRFYIEGAKCQACLWILEQIPDRLNFVASSRFNLDKSVLEVVALQEGQLSKIPELIQSYGYIPHLVFEDAKASELRRKEKRKELTRLGVAFASAGNIMLLSASVYAGLEGRLKEWFDAASLLLALPSVTYCSIPFYRSTFGALKNKTFSIDISVSLGIVFGFLFSAWHVFTGGGDVYFDTIAMLVFLLLGSRYLLDAAREKGMDSSLVKNFFSNTSSKKVLPDGSFQEVHASLLRAGDVIEVGAGEIVPVDGKVLKGSSYLNESVLNGESFPVKKQTGDSIYGGSENQSETLLVEVENGSGDSKMGRILERLQSNWGKQTKLARLSDQFSKNLVGAVSLLAAGVFIWFWSKGDVHTGLQHALAMVIITCPCALGFNIPLAMTIGMRKLAKHGIILKDDHVVEKAAAVENVFLDKTGTVTSGHRKAILTWEGVPKPEVLRSLESRSKHPLAKAVMNTLKESGDDELAVKEYKVKPGAGPSGIVNGKLYEIRPGNDEISAFILLEDGKKILSARVEDELEETFAQTARELRRSGKKVFLLSGDAKERTLAAQRAVGDAIEKSYWKADPLFKEKILREHPHSLMLGDGVNDALALKAADVGVAASGGVDLALSSSEVYFCSGGVNRLLKFFYGCEKLIEIVKANVALALVYNLIFITLALAGMITPLAAAILMPVSSLTLLGVSLAMLGRLERGLSK